MTLRATVPRKGPLSSLLAAGTGVLVQMGAFVHRERITLIVVNPKGPKYLIIGYIEFP